MHTRFEDIDWAQWTPQERATLLFVRRNGQVLLIRKKRGLGAGKINGPGGRLDDGESPLQCAIREVQEELRVTPTNVPAARRTGFSVCGRLRFVRVRVQRGRAVRASRRKRTRPTPIWTPLDAIPFDEMWADDRLWFPHLLNDRPFRGYFLFAGDEMLGHTLVLTTAAD